MPTASLRRQNGAENLSDRKKERFIRTSWTAIPPLFLEDNVAVGYLIGNEAIERVYAAFRRA